MATDTAGMGSGPCVRVGNLFSPMGWSIRPPTHAPALIYLIYPPPHIPYRPGASMFCFNEKQIQVQQQTYDILNSKRFLQRLTAVVAQGIF